MAWRKIAAAFGVPEGSKHPFYFEDFGDTLMGPNAFTVFLKFMGKVISNTTFVSPTTQDPIGECERSDEFAALRLLGACEFDFLV